MRVVNQAIFRILNSLSLFLLLLLGILVFISLNNNSDHVNYFLVAHGLVIGLIAIFIISDDNSGLLAQVVGIYSLIAFSCFPILEIFTDTIYWQGGQFKDIDQIIANSSITIFLLLFVIGYRFRCRLPTLINLKFPGEINPQQWIFLLIVSISLLSLTLYLYGWHFLTLFFRGGEHHADLNVELKSSFLLIEFFVRPLIFNIGLFLLYFARDKKYLSIVTMGIGAYAAFPTGLPRFLIAALYLPFLLNWAYIQAAYLRQELRMPRFFLPNILILGLFFVFPVLDIFRWYSDTDVNSINVIGLDTMLGGHFDSYQMLTRALNVGQITLGYGFLGALLFFVPRSFWPTKPIGSAQEVAHLANLSTDNLSMPLVAEFYLNFWYVGILFGAFMLGIILRSIDIRFLRAQKYEVSVQWIFYFQSAGLLLFIQRGSILSAFAYSTAVALTWLIIWFVCKAPSMSFK